MKPLLAALLLACATPLHAEPPGDLFEQARVAYDAGRFAEATQLYQSIISNGFASAEVYFNLGNAWYRAGSTGPAVASYERARYRWPRHPGIQANLSIVRQQTGALQVEETLWRYALGRLSLPEWNLVALAGYWLAGLAGAAFFLTARNRWAFRLALLGLALAGLGLVGRLRWHMLEKEPEAVIVQPGVQALFAPLDNAMPHFALPEGSLVQVRETSGSWLKIEVARQEGWIKAAACDPLSLP